MSVRNFLNQDCQEILSIIDKIYDLIESTNKTKDNLLKVKNIKLISQLKLNLYSIEMKLMATEIFIIQTVEELKNNNEIDINKIKMPKSLSNKYISYDQYSQKRRKEISKIFIQNKTKQKNLDAYEYLKRRENFQIDNEGLNDNQIIFKQRIKELEAEKNKLNYLTGRKRKNFISNKNVSKILKKTYEIYLGKEKE